jgi:hypothetical protein
MLTRPQRTIETGAQAGPAFKTIIGLDGDLKNEFPTPTLEENNVCWVRLNQLLDEALIMAIIIRLPKKRLSAR